MNVGDWAMLKLYKEYFILSFIGVTKKLTKVYINPFYILEKVGWLIYKPDVLLD